MIQGVRRARRAVDEEQISVAVVVVVDPGDAGAEALDLPLFG